MQVCTGTHVHENRPCRAAHQVAQHSLSWLWPGQRRGQACAPHRSQLRHCWKCRPCLRGGKGGLREAQRPTASSERTPYTWLTARGPVPMTEPLCRWCIITNFDIRPVKRWPSTLRKHPTFVQRWSRRVYANLNH